MGVHACTIIARNHLAQARVLAQSFRREHPDGTFDVLVLDVGRYPLASNEPFRVVAPGDLALDELELRRMATMYSVFELATALKPWLLHALLERYEHVLYLDSDMVVYRSLGDIADLARTRSLVLTPHLVAPLERPNAEPTETTVLFAGVYNLGFIAVGRDAGDFLDWWADRLRRECIVAPQEGRFVDQRWLDLVPGFRERLHVLRDPQFNVAWWNLPTRRLEWSGQEYTVDGQPLAFFHFSGYDPRAPHLLSRHQGDRPKMLLSEHPALKKICDDYAEQLLASGFLEAVELPYGYDSLATGVPVTTHMRRLYRAAVRDAEAEGAPLPPVPFDPTGEQEFLAWLREPGEPGAEPRVSRYLRFVWAHRPDVQQAFPDLRWTHSAAYLRWVATRGRIEERIPSELVPEPDGLRNGDGGTGDRIELGRGVNLVAGEPFRAVPEAIRLAGVPFADVDSFGDEAPYDTNVVCADEDGLLAFKHDLGPGLFEGRYTIGVWRWQLPAFPHEYQPAVDAVDEVWVESEFVRDAVGASTDKPVHVLPVTVEVAAAPQAARPEGGLPGGVVFLLLLDLLDDVQRTNPIGAIEAYTRAFKPGEGAHLVVRSVHGGRALEDYELLHAATRRSDITFVDGDLSSEERSGLLAGCDCYLSLHRSEGFGPAIAEAMAFGSPAVATAFSGNLEYMTAANGYLVPFTPVAAPGGGEWAEPDVEAAAVLLRHVLDDRDDAAARGAHARADIVERHTAEQAAAFVRARLAEVRNEHGGARARVGAGIPRP